MIDIEENKESERGKLLLKWRTMLGWSAAHLAEIFGVTTRTISAFESGAQPIQDTRWRLLCHEVLRELGQLEDNAELVVVLNEQQTPIDVVSSESYSGCVMSDDGKTGLIASHYIDRLTGKADVHRQLFQIKFNAHVIKAARRWDEKHLNNGGAAFSVQHWLNRQVLMNELTNPKLIKLKEAVAKAHEAAVGASQESEEIRRDLLRNLDIAIANLMEEAAKQVRRVA